MTAVQLLVYVLVRLPHRPKRHCAISKCVRGRWAMGDCVEVEVEVEVEPNWDKAAQPAPDFEADQRSSW